MIKYKKIDEPKNKNKLDKLKKVCIFAVSSVLIITFFCLLVSTLIIVFTAL